MSIKETVEQLVADLLDDIRRNHEAAGQKVTGKTISSLESSVLDEGEGSLRVQVSGFSYMGVLDTGAQPARRKGTDEEREEMIKNLTEWCRMRGVPESGLTEDKYRQFAKYLKWRIMVSRFYILPKSEGADRRHSHRTSAAPAYSRTR